MVCFLGGLIGRNVGLLWFGVLVLSGKLVGLLVWPPIQPIQGRGEQGGQGAGMLPPSPCPWRVQGGYGGCF